MYDFEGRFSGVSEETAQKLMLMLTALVEGEGGEMEMWSLVGSKETDDELESQAQTAEL